MFALERIFESIWDNWMPRFKAIDSCFVSLLNVFDLLSACMSGWIIWVLFVNANEVVVLLYELSEIWIFEWIFILNWIRIILNWIFYIELNIFLIKWNSKFQTIFFHFLSKKYFSLCSYIYFPLKVHTIYLFSWEKILNGLFWKILILIHGTCVSP